VKKIEVVCGAWGESWVLGTLADNGTHLLFEYSLEALSRGIEFSPRNLKLRAEAYSDFPHHQYRLPGLIADSLPDGWGMLLMDRLITKIGKSREQISPLDRLGMMGDRTMGAFSFRPPLGDSIKPVEMSLLTLANEVRQEMHGQDSEVLKALMMIGGSPHGARPKALVQYDIASAQVSTLDDSLGTPWLIKFQAQNEHKEVCAIEDVYAAMARACQLDIPKTHYFDLDPSLASFGIERFDRANGQRVPIHTLAGLLNTDFRVPSVGYDTLLRATTFITRSERELEKVFERCVFNVIFNNRDDHAKNFSFRMNEQMQWELAPCYDLTYNEGPRGEHQMDILGEGRMPSKVHLLELADCNGLKIKWASEVIDRISQVAGTFSGIAKNHAIRKQSINTIAGTIEENRRRMLN
jgi:serine/threonine-protein kinase HipA